VRWKLAPLARDMPAAHRERRAGLPRDGVPLVAAADGGQARARHAAHDRVRDARGKDHGVAAALPNVEAGVPAHQACRRGARAPGARLGLRWSPMRPAVSLHEATCRAMQQPSPSPEPGDASTGAGQRRHQHHFRNNPVRCCPKVKAWTGLAASLAAAAT
jgi:hypothetical protein